VTYAPSTPLIPYTASIDISIIPTQLNSVISVLNNIKDNMSFTVQASQPFAYQMQIGYHLPLNAMMKAGEDLYTHDYTIVVCGDEVLSFVPSYKNKSIIKNIQSKIIKIKDIMKHFSISNQGHPDCIINKYETLDSTCTNPFTHPEFSVTTKQKTNGGSTKTLSYTKDELTI
jgi:hypothetical protein